MFSGDTFCTMSETVCDIANQAFKDSPRDAPPHRLDGLGCARPPKGAGPSLEESY